LWRHADFIHHVTLTATITGQLKHSLCQNLSPLFFVSMEVLKWFLDKEYTYSEMSSVLRAKIPVSTKLVMTFLFVEKFESSPYLR
jgi:hypothetical protein